MHVTLSVLSLMYLNSAGNLVRSEVGNERGVFLTGLALRGKACCKKSIPSHVPPQPRPRGRAEGDTVRRSKKEVGRPCGAAGSAFEATEPGFIITKPDCESSGRQIMGGSCNKEENWLFYAQSSMMVISGQKAVVKLWNTVE